MQEYTKAGWLFQFVADCFVCFSYHLVFKNKVVVNILQKHALIYMWVGMKFVGHKVSMFTILQEIGNISQILPSMKHIILIQVV